MMSNAFKEGLLRDERKMKEIRARAQMNEHVYSILKSSGIEISADIGMEYCNVS